MKYAILLSIIQSALCGKVMYEFSPLKYKFVDIDTTFNDTGTRVVTCDETIKSTVIDSFFPKVFNETVPISETYYDYTYYAERGWPEKSYFDCLGNCSANEHCNFVKYDLQTELCNMLSKCAVSYEQNNDFKTSAKIHKFDFTWNYVSQEYVGIYDCNPTKTPPNVTVPVNETNAYAECFDAMRTTELANPERMFVITSDYKCEIFSKKCENPNKTNTDYRVYYAYEFNKYATFKPSSSPTRKPTGYPTIYPSRNPTNYPTRAPSDIPSISPTMNPTYIPSSSPISPPTPPTPLPTRYPTKRPTQAPTSTVTSHPTTPTRYPTGSFPTREPTTISQPVSIYLTSAGGVAAGATLVTGGWLLWRRVLRTRGLYYS